MREKDTRFSLCIFGFPIDYVSPHCGTGSPTLCVCLLPLVFPQERWQKELTELKIKGETVYTVSRPLTTEGMFQEIWEGVQSTWHTELIFVEALKKNNRQWKIIDVWAVTTSRAKDKVKQDQDS